MNKKVEVLANCFKLVSSNENYDQLFLAARKSFIINNKNINMKQSKDDSILNEDFNIQELTYTVRNLKNTAPGQDNITNVNY